MAITNEEKKNKVYQMRCKKCKHDFEVKGDIQKARCPKCYRKMYVELRRTKEVITK